MSPRRSWRRAAAVGLLALTAACSPGPRDVAPPVDRPAPATAAPSATAGAMTRSRPVEISIADIGVDAPVIRLGLTPGGALEVPRSGPPAGWYTGSPTPGEVGPSVIAGHVHYDDEDAVFEDLQTLRPTALVDVGRADGSTARFAVDRVQVVEKSAFPTTSVYGDLDHPGLRLITCGGYDPAADTYDQNVVVYASLVDDPA